jgi:hypothetical protein
LQLVKFFSAFSIIIIIIIDYTETFPQLHGVSYFLFNLPYGSFKEVALWLGFVFVGSSYLLGRDKGLYNATSGIFSLILSIIIIYKFILTILYVSPSGYIDPLTDSSSVYATTVGRLFGLIVLQLLLLPQIFTTFKSLNKKP